MNHSDISVVMPAKNEASAIRVVIEAVRNQLPDAEVLVIDDGSSDLTAEVASTAGARIISHRYTMGNGAAIKTGARSATGEIIVFMDADGQHDPADIPRLLERINEGYDMAVGARTVASQASIWRGFANWAYNRLASYMTGQKIQDLTSGFRAVRAGKVREFLYLFPNGFSYPTTVTMNFFRSGYPVAYVPITANRRVGNSHISPVRDGLRFLLIIFKIGSLYSPLKLFAPVAMAHALFGIGYYGYTYFSAGRLSVATIFLLTAAVTIFLIGLVSEQITALMYKDSGNEASRD
jgi:glycosyltransferase involved in cell wall biosynthesis